MCIRDSLHILLPSPSILSIQLSLTGYRISVLSFLLRIIQSNIRISVKGCKGSASLRRNGHADAGSDLPPSRTVYELMVQFLYKALHLRCQPVLRRYFQKYDEFISPDAAYDIVMAELTLQNPGKISDNTVSYTHLDVYQRQHPDGAHYLDGS